MYPLGDFLIRIKNGYLVNKDEVVVSWSKVKEAVARLLVEHSYLAGCQVDSKDKKKKKLQVSLKYKSGKPVLKGLSLFSKPGRRFYSSWQKLPYFKRGKGIIIVSTSSGLMTVSEARKNQKGGEIICSIW